MQIHQYLLNSQSIDESAGKTQRILTKIDIIGCFVQAIGTKTVKIN